MTAALAIVDDSRKTLPSLTRVEDVPQFATGLFERARRTQSDRGKRPYSLRTVSRLSRVLRSAGWIDVALVILERTVP